MYGLDIPWFVHFCCLAELSPYGPMSSSAISVVGLRSRATGVARVETVAGLLNLIPRLFEGLFTFYGRATPDARERIYHATRADHRRSLCF